MNDDNCILIELEQGIAGFSHFIGSWLYRGDANLLVDVGPASSATRLVEVLTKMNVNKVDYVLVTHIHIDHAGGLAEVLKHFPMARVVCHDKGIRHLVDPSKLWEGSQKVLGEIAVAYGPPAGVEEDVFIAHTQAQIKNLAVIETPGHAANHMSFTYGGNLFAGEAGGNYLSIQDMDYLRPATPPKFFMKELLNSVDRLVALGKHRICYAHFGAAPNSQHMLKRFRAQVFRWKEIIQQEMSSSTGDLITRCVDSLLEKDPDLKAFMFMEPDVQKRERYFMANSVRGYIGFLQGAS